MNIEIINQEILHIHNIKINMLQETSREERSGLDKAVDCRRLRRH